MLTFLGIDYIILIGKYAVEIFFMADIFRTRR